VEKGQGKGAPLFFFINFLLLRGRGVEVNVIFFASLEMWKEEGKWVHFFPF
jgi:hypothetical protein